MSTKDKFQQPQNPSKFKLKHRQSAVKGNKKMKSLDEGSEINSISKPKSPNLYKKKKQKGTNFSKKEHAEGIQVPLLSPGKKNIKRKFEKVNSVDDQTKSIKKVTFASESKNNNDSNKKNLKRKQNFGDSSKKKFKPDGIKRKDWKMLHLNKKTPLVKSDKAAETTETKPATKHANMTKNEWKKIHLQKKGKTQTFEVGQKLKTLWEELRRDDCKGDRKSILLKQACDLLKGKVKEFTFAHDTVRVLECIVAEGTDADRTFLFEELKGDIIVLAKSKYGKFFLLKMLKYGTKQQKETIMKVCHGKVVKLMKHTEAAEVVEMAFNECANATQRFEFVQEFYGSTYKYFKTLDFHNLKELFEKEPEKKTNIVQHMKGELLKLTEKSVIKHSIVHHVLWQFMIHADSASKAEMIESIRDAVPEILHSKDGSRAAMHCVWFGTIKDRKVIVKSMKPFVAKVAKEEHGHMVLLAIFDCVDDTKLVEKYIIQELKKNIVELSQDTHGKKVLIYLLNHRDPHFIHPDVINILSTGDGNESSKKDLVIRKAELKAAIEDSLVELVQSNIGELHKNNAFCLLALTILQHTIGKRTEAFRAISMLAVEPYTADSKDSHVIEHGGSNFFLKKLIIQDKSVTDHETFSEILISTVPKLVFKSWINCNRGAFLLVSLLETGISSVVERIKEDLSGMNGHIEKKAHSSKGAEILLKKLIE